MKYLTVNDAVQQAYALHQQMSAGDRAAAEKAERLYMFALNHAPSEPAVLYLTGSFYAATGKYGLGAVLLAASLEADPKNASAWNNLGIAFRQMHNTQRARECFSRALACGDPDKPDASSLNNIATSYNDEGEYESAIEWYDKAISLDPSNYDAAFNRSMALLSLGRWAEGWDAYNMGHMAGATIQKTRGLRNYATDTWDDPPVWDGRKARCVIVWGEQGIGDEVLFASCLPDIIARSDHVVFDCHKRLVDIFRRSFPSVTCFPTREDKEMKWPWPKSLPAPDAKISIASLPGLFRRSADAFPDHAGYLKADPELVSRYRDPSKFRVGISTCGGTPQTGQERRSIPIDLWGPVLSVPGVEFVSLDYVPESAERMAQAREIFGASIIHDAEMIADLDKQFACIAGLDLVIAVNTSVVHFSGALNVPCLTLTPKVSAWRYGRDGMPWYRSVEILRQTELGKWEQPMAEAAERLKGWRR